MYTTYLCDVMYSSAVISTCLLIAKRLCEILDDMWRHWYNTTKSNNNSDSKNHSNSSDSSTHGVSSPVGSWTDLLTKSSPWHTILWACLVSSQYITALLYGRHSPIVTAAVITVQRLYCLTVELLHSTSDPQCIQPMESTLCREDLWTCFFACLLLSE